MFTLSYAQVLPGFRPYTATRSNGVLLYLSRGKAGTAMNRDSEYSGSPIRLQYPRASRQTEEQVSSRNRQPRQQTKIDDEDGNPDAWEIDKPHSSVIRYDRPIAPRKTTGLQGRRPAKKTRIVGYRRFFMARFLVIFGLLLFVLALG